jgi:TolB-like protein
MRAQFYVRFALILLAFSFIMAAAGQSLAGQVVTDEIHQWAHKAVQEEANLDLKTASNTVAVLYFRNLTKQPDLDFLQKGMAIMLITDLAKLDKIRVVERTHLQALAEELKLGVSGLVAPDASPRVGRLLGARYLVGGDVSAAAPKIIDIKSNLLNVPSAHILGSPDSQGTMDRLIDMEKEILFEIVRLLNIELSEAQKAELRKPMTTNIKALKLFIQGIEKSDAQAYDQASDYYHDALKLDPRLTPAQAAFLEIEHMGSHGMRLRAWFMLNRLHKRVSVNNGPTPGQLTRRAYSEPVSVQGPAGGGTADVRVQW